LTPALTALTEEWRLRPEKLVKPLRWLSAYLQANNPKKAAKRPPSRQGTEQERVVHQEKEAAHATSLIKAACADNPTHVEFWMDIGGPCAQMNAKETRLNYRGWTCLHYAVLNNNATLARHLLEAGVDVNEADQYGLTAIMIAAYMGHIEVVEVLLDFTVGLDSLSYNDKAPMEPQCGSTGSTNAVLFGHSALHWALEKYASEGSQWSCYHPELAEAEAQRVDRKATIAQVILEHGCDADQFSATNLSAWHMACMLPGFTVAAEQLKTYGGYLASDGFPKAELLCLAATQGNVPMLTFLRKEGLQIDERDEHDRTALYCAADAGWHETVTWLGEEPKSADLGARCTEEKRLPLHAAVANGHLQCVKALANLGADMEAESGAGRTPLHTGARCGHGEVVDHLIAIGVKINATDAAGVTPYVLASAEGNLSIAKSLCEAKADPHLADQNGDFSIHYAAARGQLELVEYALYKGIKVDVQNQAGHTALMVAARAGHFATMKFLEMQSAEVNATDGCNTRALHFASEGSHLEIMQYLCESGAELDAVDSWGRSALYLAAKHNHIEAVECLILNGAGYDLQTIERVNEEPPAAAVEGEAAVPATAAAERPGTAQSRETNVEKEKIEEEEEPEEELVEVAGRTALHIAADGLHVGVVKLLGEGGAEVDVEADDGLTPLLTAIISTAEAPESVIVQIVEILVEGGASLTVTDFDGRTPLQNAEVLERRCLAHKLRELGALQKNLAPILT